jgi:hypothetical protein
LPSLVLLGMVEEVAGGFRLTPSAREELATHPVANEPGLR